MTTHKYSRRAAVRARVKRIWSAISDANRRMLDIRTGAHLMKPQDRSSGRTTG
ncbi:MAG: hypothetical protein JO243_10410 [Solirubrobacterales bacterium]|nr:hypothetical protein [Solirubrobacterales bacterium]